MNLRVNNNGTEAAALYVTRDDGAALTLVGVPNTLTTGTTTAVPGRGYTVAWGGAVPPKPRFFLNRTQVGEWARITVPYPTGNIRMIRDYNSGSPLVQAGSVSEVDNATGAAWYYEAGTGMVHLKLVTNANGTMRRCLSSRCNGWHCNRGKREQKGGAGRKVRPSRFLCPQIRRYLVDHDPGDGAMEQGIHPHREDGGHDGKGQGKAPPQAYGPHGRAKAEQQAQRDAAEPEAARLIQHGHAGVPAPGGCRR